MNLTPRQPVILQVIPELGPGGAEQGCLDMAQAIQDSGGIALVVSQGGSRLHELARTGARHIDLPVKSKNPYRIYKNAQRLTHIIRDYGVNIVHARSRAPAWSAYLAWQKSKKAGREVRFMTTCHAPYAHKSAAKRLYNSVMAKGERVIAISQFVADYLKNDYAVNPDLIKVIHRGVAMDKFHPTAVTPRRLISLTQKWRIPDGSEVVLLPGRLTRWKGHHVLIEAINRLQRPDLFCVIIGSDQGRVKYRQELEELIEAKKLGGQVRIVDHCDDMPAAYMLASVVVSASTEPEGFGRVPVEAQAMGRPIIAAGHGGAKETVLHGQTGWLVKPGDPYALANALNEVLSLSITQRSVLATKAMGHVADNFTKDLMADKTLDVYASLLKQGAYDGI